MKVTLPTHGHIPTAKAIHKTMFTLLRLNTLHSIPPTTSVVDCYANIVLPTPPTVTDNCGVTLTPTGPVESGSVTCEGDITYTWTYTDCEGNTQDYVHTVTIEYLPFAAIPPTTAVVDCYANIVLTNSTNCN